MLWKPEPGINQSPLEFFLACKLREKTNQQPNQSQNPKHMFCYFLSFTGIFVWKMFISTPPVFSGVKTKSKTILVGFYRKEI